MGSSRLEKVFDTYLRSSSEGQHWVNTGQEWSYCNGAILCKMTRKKDTKPEAFPGKIINDNLRLQPSMAYPENLFLPICEISGNFSDCYIGHGIAYATGTRECLKLKEFADVPMMHCKLRLAPADEYLKEFGGYLGYFKKSRLPMVRLQEGDSLLWVLFGNQNTVEEDLLYIDGKVYKPDAWNDKLRAYMKLTEVKELNNSL